ncbi:hypothetical protein L7F22_060449 [Adiantum nelumboides]|nr:hypothetical protein [Adiantum nelumboides]
MIYKKLMHRDRDLVVLRKVLEQIEQERREMVHSEDCKAEMEKMREECKRITDDLIELEKKPLEEKVLKQQREIDLMRFRMEEIEREVQLLLKINHQPCFVKQSLVPQKIHQVGKPSFEVADIERMNEWKEPRYLGNLAEVTDANVCKDATECTSARECTQDYNFSAGLDAQVYSTSGMVATLGQDTFEISGWLPAIPEESEGEDPIPDQEASHHWNLSDASEHMQGQESILNASTGQTLSILQENWTVNTGLAKANSGNEKSCGLTSTDCRTSRIENIFMLCGNQRELIGTNHGSVDKQITEHTHQQAVESRINKQVNSMTNSLAMESSSPYVWPGPQLPSSSKEPSSGALDSERKLIASPKYSPIHVTGLKPKQTSSDSSPVHNRKHSSLENTPPHGRSPISLASSSHQTS